MLESESSEKVSSKRKSYLLALANLTQTDNVVSKKSQVPIGRKIQMSDLPSFETQICLFRDLSQQTGVEAFTLAINQNCNTNADVIKIMDVLSQKGFQVSLEKGTLIVEFPSNVHQTTVGRIIVILDRQVNDTAKISPGSTMRVALNTRKEADVMFRPRDRATPNGPREVDNREFPSTVFEVAYTHPATYNELSQLLTDWLSPQTTVMIAIGIKIGIDNVRKDSNQAQKSRLRFIMKTRGNSVPFEREFGPGFCDADGNPNFMVNLPTQILFDRAPLPPNLPANVIINLFQLKNHILEDF